MRQIAKRRMEKLSPERRRQIAGKGGKAWWDKLTDEEKRRAIERLQKARRQKRREEKGTAKSVTSARAKSKQSAKTISPRP